jgi:hypothetical protein
MIHLRNALPEFSLFNLCMLQRLLHSEGLAKSWRGNCVGHDKEAPVETGDLTCLHVTYM